MSVVQVRIDATGQGVVYVDGKSVQASAVAIVSRAGQGTRVWIELPAEVLADVDGTVLLEELPEIGLPDTERPVQPAQPVEGPLTSRLRLLGKGAALS